MFEFQRGQLGDFNWFSTEGDEGPFLVAGLVDIVLVAGVVWARQV